MGPHNEAEHEDEDWEFELHSIPVTTPKFSLQEQIHTFDPRVHHCDYENYGGSPLLRSGASTPYSLYSMYSAAPMSTSDVVLAFLREAKAEAPTTPPRRSNIEETNSIATRVVLQEQSAIATPNRSTIAATENFLKPLCCSARLNDQLARRVSELAKQEQKLLLRCTAIEQERLALTDKLGALTTAVAEGQEAQSKLRQQLSEACAEKEAAVRQSLELQTQLALLQEA
eukprot:gene6175-6413_t